MGTDAVRSCYSKRYYATEKIARRVAQQAEEARGARLRVYGCEECGGFHLTRRLSAFTPAATPRPDEPETEAAARGAMAAAEPEPPEDDVDVTYRLTAMVFEPSGRTRSVNLSSCTGPSNVQAFLSGEAFASIVAERLGGAGLGADDVTVLLRRNAKGPVLAIWKRRA